MTQDLIDKAERRKIASIAREYRSKGYRVTLQPRGEDLPPFLRDFDIDLLAESSQEHVAVEVKTRRSLSQAHDLPQLARALQDRPGWRLELIVPRLRGADREFYGHQLLNRQQILDRLSEVEVLVRQRLFVAATLVAWTAAEAALRLVAQQNEVRLTVPTSAYAVAQSYSMGLIDREQYDLLYAAADSVNAMTHGYSANAPNREYVMGILTATEQILNC